MKAFILLCISFLLGCRPDAETPTNPEEFLSDLIPKNQLAHGGVLSPNGKQFYITLSDTLFQNFEVMVSQKRNNQWQSPEPAFFNSLFDEHGVAFAPFGNQLYFSSTRPTGIDSLPRTWHIWRCTKTKDGWSDAEYVAIPTMSQKLVSHPSLTQNGRMYFHSGGVDYSELALFYSDQIDGQFSIPHKVELSANHVGLSITPFIAYDESYLLFGQIRDGQEALYYSQNTNGNWQQPLRLPDAVNTDNKANPFIDASGQYLYYASGSYNEQGVAKNWIIKRAQWKDVSDSLRFNKN